MKMMGACGLSTPGRMMPWTGVPEVDEAVGTEVGFLEER